MNANMGRKGADRTGVVSPRRQMYWDWRAAGNFVGGGTGGSLVFFAAWATLGGAAEGGNANDASFTSLMLAGLLLIAVGLTCVWLEIGRPWRALNVFRHPSTSWMTREASVAPFLFLSGLAAFVFGGVALTWIVSALGLGFVYSQARILTADKGIPAWRHRRCVPLVVCTGLTEGAGALALLSPWLAPQVQSWLPVLLVALLVTRLVAWRAYLGGLRQDGAPVGTLKALGALDQRFVFVGHGAPVALALIAVVLSGSGGSAALALAGVLATGSGWLLKHTLVRKAAFNQGFALPHQPVRGRAENQRAGLPVRPGWGGSGSAGL